MHTTNIFVANGVDDVNVEGLSAVTHTHTVHIQNIENLVKGCEIFRDTYEVKGYDRCSRENERHERIVECDV